MSYLFPLPDGRTIRVPSGTPISVAERWARQDFPELYKEEVEEAPPKKEGFFSNVGEGARNFAESSGVGIGTAFSPSEARTLAERANARESDVKTTSWEDVKKAGREQGVLGAVDDFGAFARDTLGQAFPQIGATIAGAGAGGAAGSVLGPIGAAVGAGAGGIAANLPAMFGGNIQRQVQESPGEAPNLGAAGAAAVGMAALDAVPVLGLLGRLGVSKVAGEGIQQLLKKSPAEVEAKLLRSARQSMLAAGGKGAAIGVAVEMPAEVAQAVLERAQAGLSLTSPEALQEYEANAAGALVVGAPLGAAGRLSERSRGQDAQLAADNAVQQNTAEEASEQEQRNIQRQTSPEYLLNLDAEYRGVQSQLKEIQEEIKAIGKPDANTSEAEQRKILERNRRELIEANKPLLREHAERRKAIDGAKERARIEGMSPEEFMLERMGAGVAVEPGAEPATLEEGAITEQPQVSDPAISRAQEIVASVLTPFGGVAVPGTEADIVDALMQQPDIAAQALADRTEFPSLSRQQNAAVRDALGLQMKDREQLGEAIASGRESARSARLEEAVSEADTQRAVREAEEVLSLLQTKPPRATTSTADARPGEAKTAAYSKNRDLTAIEEEIKQQDDLLKEYAKETLEKNGKLTDAGRAAALVQTRRDELLTDREQLLQDIRRKADRTPVQPAKTNIEALITAALAPRDEKNTAASQGAQKRVPGNEGFVLGPQLLKPRAEATPEEKALVQKMREDDIARINDAVTEGRITGDAADRADRAIQILIDGINAPASSQDIAAAKNLFAERDAATPDFFREGVDEDLTSASEKEAAAQAEAKNASLAFGRALGRMKDKAAGNETAKEELKKYRSRLPETKSKLQEAVEKAAAARAAKLSAADAERSAAQRVQQREIPAIKQRIDEARRKKEIAEKKEADKKATKDREAQAAKSDAQARMRATPRAGLPGVRRVDGKSVAILSEKEKKQAAEAEKEERRSLPKEKAAAAKRPVAPVSTQKAQASKKKDAAARKARLDAAEALKTEQEINTEYEDLDLGFGEQDRFFASPAVMEAPTVKQIREAQRHPLNGMTVKEAAQWAVRNTKNPIQRALMQRVAQGVANADGEVSVSMEFDATGPGMYDAASNRITLSPRIFADTEAVVAVLNHELVHAATVRGLSIDKKLEEDIGKVIQRARKWARSDEGRKFLARNPALLQDDPRATFNERVYGLTNPQEFLAETFSSSAFQDMLKSIPYEGPAKALWDGFLRFIGRMFGAKSPQELGALAEVIDLGERAILSNYIANETGTEALQGRFAAPQRKYENAAIGAAAKTIIGERASITRAIQHEATGLGFRTRFIDSYAGLKEALRKGDATKAIQVSYDLMTFAQRNHFVQQAVTTGAPVREKWTLVNGKQTFKTEAKEGPNLKRVMELLSKVKGFGNAQATSDAFTLLALGMRAKTRGWDTVFADGDKDSAEKKAEKAKAREEATKLANAYAAGTSPFSEAYKEYQAFNKSMFSFARDSGVISDNEYRDAVREGNYTPLFRKDKNNNLVLKLDSGRTITVGRLGDEAHLNKLVGGETQVFDFFTASVKNASVLIDASLHNIAAREAAFALLAMGAARKLGAKEKSPNVIEFRTKGQEELQRFEVDTEPFGVPTELVAKGFAGVPATLPNIVRLLGVPATLLRKAVTRNPLYMARQLVRDPMSAWLTTGANFSPISDTVKELSASLRGTNDKTLERRGLTGGMLFAEDDTDIERIAGTAGSMPGWSVGYIAAKLDDMSLAADAVTRRNVYNGALRQGASEIEATLAAYESMPFSKRGTSASMRYANHMVPFLSATIQGWDVLYRAVKGDMPLNELVDVRKKLLQRGAVIGGITMLYAMAMEDDEAYKNANTSVRLSNWFLRVPGTEQTIKVPVPFELGIIFKMLPEALYRSAAEDKELGKELKDVGGAVLGMVPSLWAPQALLPIVEVSLNKSFFTGNPIEGKMLESVDIGQRYDKSTSELSKLLGFDVEFFGSQMGISPKKLEYLASQYTAGLYPAFAAIIDTILPAPTAEKPDRTLAEMPVFRSALLQTDEGGQVNRLYDRIERMTKYDATFKKLLQEDPSKAEAYAKDNAAKIGASAVARKAQATLNKFSELENTIRNNASMTGEQKKKALDGIKQIKTNLASQFSKALRE